MDNNDKYIDAQKIDYRIQNKKRGEILFYSIDQVADLLNESTGNVKYYTNIYDDLLKVEIVDKELRYTNDDVDKLELLIKLKNRGMSLKEIHDYYNKLPLNDTEVQRMETNLLSVEELIDSIKEEQQLQLDIFKAQLTCDIENTNALYLQNIVSIVIEAQNNGLNELKQNLSKEIKEYLDFKFDNIYKIDMELHDKLLADTTDFISEKVDHKNEELKITLHNDFNTFAQESLVDNERLIKEVKDFKRVMMDSYDIQYQMEMEKASSGFWNRLFQVIKLK